MYEKIDFNNKTNNEMKSKKKLYTNSQQVVSNPTIKPRTVYVIALDYIYI